MKHFTTAMLISTAMIATGCGDDEHKRQQQNVQYQQPQQMIDPQQQNLQYQQPMVVQPQPMMNPQGQPIIINNTTPAPQSQVSHDNSGSSALVGLAAGAALGAVTANMMNDNDRDRGTHTIEKHYIERSPQTPSYQQPIQPTQNFNATNTAVPTTQIASKSEKNAMDMNKLTESTKTVAPSQKIENTTNTNGTANKMDMSKLNSAAPLQPQTQQKPAPRMDMSKFTSQPVQKPSSIGGALNKSSSRVNFKK